MSLYQLDTENADRDIKTASIAVLTHTPTVAAMCIGLIKLGDGTKNLDGTGGSFQLVITVGGQTVQPSPQTVTFSTAVRAAIWTTMFPVPANNEVIIKVLSPNAADSDVDCTAYLYDTTFALPAAAHDTAGGLPISDAGGLDLDAIKTMTDKIGTITNTGGTATLGAILGDFANTTLTGRTPTGAPGANNGALTTNGTKCNQTVDLTASQSIAVSDKTGFSLTAAYDPAKTAAQAGNQMDFVNAPNATAITAIRTVMEASGSDLDLLIRTLVNKLLIIEASGDVELFTDAGVSAGTVLACFTSIAGVTQRKSMRP